MRQLASVTLIISALLLTACGGGGSSAAPAARPPANNVPVASDMSVKTNVDESLDATLSGQDADGDVLTYSVTAPPALGTVEILDAATGAYRFTPLAAAFGPDQFRYRVNDGTDDSAEAVVSIVVNRKPTAEDQSVRVAASLPAVGDLVGTDADADPISFVIATQPVNGTVVLDAVTGSFTYNATANFEGTDSFTYQTNDGFADSPEATVTLSVNEWLGTVNLGTAADEHARYGLQIDDESNLYVAYSTTGNLPGEVSSGGEDVVLAMINKAGTVEWQTQWGHAGNEGAYQFVRHSDGSLYITSMGREDDGTLIAAYLVKFDENGDLLWELTYPVISEIMQYYRLAISPNGNVYVNLPEPFQEPARRGRLMKITPDGTIEWTKVLGTIADDPLDPLLVGGPYDAYNVFPRGLAVDATETIYMTLTLSYTIAGNSSTTAMLASFDSDGTILSRVEPLVSSAFPINTNVPILRDIRVTAAANLRVLGDRLLPDDSWGVVAVELDTAGNEIWATPRSVADENRRGFIGTLTADGSSIVAGAADTVVSAGANINAGVTKFDSTGGFVWERVLSGTLADGTTDVRDDIGNPVTDANGSVFVLVSSNGGAIGSATNQGGWDVFLVKLDGDTGQMIHP